jgi:SOS-response transcriptional repressor LexA
MREDLASRLKATRQALKLTQEQLAERSGISQSDISKIERRATIKPVGVLALARALGCNPYWLESGIGEKAHMENVLAVTTRGRVPLISWVAAGKLGEITDMYLPGEAEHWIDAYETQPGEQAFALRVDGDSMTSPYPGEVSFPSGSIIIVDPSRACDAGDYVVAKDVSTQEATFKKLVKDGGRWYLKPLNTSYPTIEIDDPALRVIGRVVESQIRRKL